MVNKKTLITCLMMRQIKKLKMKIKIYPTTTKKWIFSVKNVKVKS